MQLKNMYVELPDFKLSDYTHAYDLRTPLGFFDHISGILNCYYDSKWQDLPSDPEKLISQLKEETTKYTFDEKLKYLLKRTVGFHEYRHYLDCFCTPHGFSLFHDFIYVYAMKASLILSLLTNRNFNSPVALKHEKLTGDIGRLQYCILHKEEHITLNTAPKPIGFFSGHDTEHDFYIAKIKDSFGVEIILPCITLNIIRNGKAQFGIWPIGFTLITETLATIHQDIFICSVDENVRNAGRNLLGSTLNPYYPLIANLCRIFKNRGVAVKDVKDSLLYELLFSSLFVRTGSCFGDEDNIDICGAGNRLLSIIENQCEVENNEIIFKPERIDRNEYIASKGIPKGFPFDFITHVRDNYYQKSLDIREQNENLPFTSLSSIFLYQPLLPKPPLIAMSDGVISVNDPVFLELWQNLIMYMQIVDSFWNGTTCTCPVMDDNYELYYRYDSLRPCPTDIIKCKHSTIDTILPSMPIRHDCLWHRFVNSFISKIPSGE